MWFGFVQIKDVLLLFGPAGMSGFERFVFFLAAKEFAATITDNDIVFFEGLEHIILPIVAKRRDILIGVVCAES